MTRVILWPVKIFLFFLLGINLFIFVCGYFRAPVEGGSFRPENEHTNHVRMPEFGEFETLQVKSADGLSYEVLKTKEKG